MQPLQDFATRVLTEVIRRQPASPERTAFAWEITVGPALARSSSVELQENGVLVVSARDVQWARELDRAAATILERMQSLLGPAAVRTLEIADVGGGSHKPRRQV